MDRRSDRNRTPYPTLDSLLLITSKAIVVLTIGLGMLVMYGCMLDREGGLAGTLGGSEPTATGVD